jgi:LDH2 family malate/lactate/ureidoglycolate dehydrogenase
VLAGDDTADPTRVGNNLAVLVIAVDPEFRAQAGSMAEYVQSSPPRDGNPVILPGRLEYDRRSRANEVVIGETTWDAILERARRAGVVLD